MRRFIAIVMMVGFMAGSAHAGLISVDVYSGFAQVDGGAPYSGLVGSFSSNDIQFATNTGYAWHPFALFNFGAEMNGFLDASASQNYSFELDSDDGSMLYIDNVLVVDNGGPHGPTKVANTTFLNAGVHSFRVEFFEDFGGPSGVDLTLPAGVAFSPVPAPGAAVLVVIGLGMANRFRRRFSA